MGHRKKVTRPDGKPIPDSHIGLGNRNKSVRATLPPTFSLQLEQFDDWLNYLALYRHSLAHRIPLYIPPHLVDPKHEAEYQQLEQAIMLELDPARRKAFEDRQMSICHFKSIMLYDLDKSREVFFHAQSIADFKTLETITDSFVLALREG